MDRKHETLTFAVDCGKELLKYGGEIYRVKDTIEMILCAYGIPNYDVYVLSNGIFVSITDDEDEVCSTVRDIPSWSMNLAGICSINQLSRDICTGKYDLEEAMAELKRIKKAPVSSERSLILACTLCTACFCYLFGGTVNDSLFTLIVGFFLQIFTNFASRKKMSRFVTQLLSAMLVACISILPYLMGFPLHQDKIIIGAIMPIVPGIVFTTSIRDFINGDYLSGTIHMIDALLTAFAIAMGVGSIITVAHIYLGGSFSL